jgi:hypothetical protein
MTNIIPNSNLPASSQPWGREIQKRLQTLESEVARQKINTSSANSQLQSSYKKVDETVSELIKLSEPEGEYRVNVANLTGEIFTSPGIDIQITDPGNRKNYLEKVVGKIYSDVSGYTSLSGFKNIDGDLVGFGEFISRYGIVIENLPTAFPTGGASPVAPDPVVIKPSLIVSNLIGSSTTGASIDNTGKIIRTPSSERYKQDIEPLNVNYDDLLSLEPKRFKFKSEASENENARYYAGFIAEEVAETSLTDFVAYTIDEDGNKIPDGVYYAELSAALLSALKHQDQLIKSILDRVQSLEESNKV